MKDLIRKIEIHLETTEECIENTSLPPYVVELLEADNRLLSEVVTKYKTEGSFSEEDMINFAFDTYCYISGIMKVPFNKLSENKNHAKDNFETFKNK